MVGSSTVLKADMACSNGVIHVIDSKATPNKIKFTVTESLFGAGMSTGGIVKMQGDGLQDLVELIVTSEVFLKRSS